VFSSAALAGNHPGHDELVFGHKAQSFETAGTVVIVLEQEIARLQRSERLFGNGIISASGVPISSIVSAAQMNPQNDDSVLLPFMKNLKNVPVRRVPD
jgi:hypothetical protein